MKIQAESVDKYLQQVPEERKIALEQLRNLCLEIFDGYQESMEYGMPSYKEEQQEVEVAFASQKNYISLYVMKEEVFNAFRDDFSGLGLGKGCIRFRKPEQMDFSLIGRLLRASFESDAEIC